MDSFFDYLQQNYLSTSDNHSQHFHVTAPAKDVVSPKLLKEARTVYPIYERKAEKLFFGIPKKGRPALRKKPFPLSKLSSFTRHGPSYLPEESLAGKEDFLSLGIRGVEFGLWMSDADAQSALDQCYHALRDLTYVLDIEPHDISPGGKLALPFGARGYGEILADYKAKQQQIDWDKALQEVYEHRCLAKPDMYLGVNGTNSSLEKLSSLHKEITGHVLPKRKRISINRSLSDLYQSEQPYRRATQAIEQLESSNYQQGSWEMHRHFAKTSHGELYEFREKFARAFDCYIADNWNSVCYSSVISLLHSHNINFSALLFYTV